MLIPFIALTMMIATVSSIMLVIDKSPYCVTKDIQQNDTIKISYQTSGEYEESIHVWFLGPNENRQEKLYMDNQIQNGKFQDKDVKEFFVEFPGTFSLCFKSFSEISSSVSFDFFTIKESGHIHSIAKEDVFEEMFKNVTEISYLLEEMEQNLKYDVERRASHSKLISDIISLVHTISYYKILVITVLALFQVCLIRRFFRNTKITESPFKESGNI